MACAIGCSPPPPAPCSTRKKRRSPRLGATPQSKELTVNTPKQVMKKRFRPKAPGEPAADRQNDGIRDQIGGQHPRALVVARAQIPGHVRQGHVGDAGVEHLHEGCQRHNHGNQPGIVLGPPNVLVDVRAAELIGGTRPAPRSCRAEAGDPGFRPARERSLPESSARFSRSCRWHSPAEAN